MSSTWVRARLSRRLVGMAAATAILALLGSTTSEAARGPVPVPVLWSPATPCQDVLFVGARGSGESAEAHDGLGTTVATVLNAYVRHLAGYRVAFAPVTYTAHDVSLLSTDPQQYFDGLEQGVSTVTQLIKQRALACPQERFVLAGYSQGAMLIHRVLIRQPELLDSVVGAILVGDGDRQPGDVNVNTYGNSRVGPRNYGVGNAFTRFSDTSPTDFGATAGGRVHSICFRADIVCDYDVALLAGIPEGIDVHKSYVARSSPIKNAARAVAQATRAVAPLDPLRLASTALPQAVRGVEYSAQLEIQGGTPPYSATKLNGSLPAGLSFEPGTHTISGTPTSTGGATFRVTVRDATGGLIPRARITIVVAEEDGPREQPSLLPLSTGPNGQGTSDWSGGGSASADGEWAVFLSRAPEYGGSPGTQVVVLANTVKRSSETVFTRDSGQVAISGDGSTLAIITADRYIWVLDRSSGRTAQVPGPNGRPYRAYPGERPHLSLDGSRILFENNASPNQVVLYDRNSGAIDTVSVSTNGDKHAGAQPHLLTPDGRFAYFFGRATNGQLSLFKRDTLDRVTSEVLMPFGESVFWWEFNLSSNGRYLATLDHRRGALVVIDTEAGPAGVVAQHEIPAGMTMPTGCIEFLDNVWVSDDGKRFYIKTCLDEANDAVLFSYDSESRSMAMVASTGFKGATPFGDLAGIVVEGPDEVFYVDTNGAFDVYLKRWER